MSGYNKERDILKKATVFSPRREVDEVRLLQLSVICFTQRSANFFTTCRSKLESIMRKITFGFLSSLAISAIAVAETLAAPVAAQTIATQSGIVSGSTKNDVTIFKGIPYAAPPTGDNRWRAPQPVSAWIGERDATSFGTDCAQGHVPQDAAPIATTPHEDCLFLNVWKPASARANAGLPVMVWIYGGGFVNGGSSPAVYSGKNFAGDGVVFVSLNYRLGRFGFFAHPALEKEGFGGNFGFLDQIAALKWVQANIAAFGGDPARVTVFGESAGGMSVHMLLQSPLARGLFHQAIIESGGGRDRTLPMPSFALAAKVGNSFAPGLDATQLRALPAEQVTGNLNMMTMNQPGYSGPMVDGRTILGSSLDAINAGLYAVVPVIVGANSADGFPFVTDKDKIFATYGKHEAEARKLYDPQGTVPGVELATQTSADRMFIEPARTVARELGKRQPVYLYRFSYAVPEVAKSMGGAPHASEIPYVFDTLSARQGNAPLPEETTVAALTHKYWINFVKTGKPDGKGVAPWPPADADTANVQIIDAAGSRNIADPLTARLDFVEGLER
jgi:para-nitrobenzyl esterase